MLTPLHVGAFGESFVGLEHPNYIFDEWFLLFSSFLSVLVKETVNGNPI